MTTIITGMTPAEFINALNDNFNAQKYYLTVTAINASSSTANINTNFTTIKNGRTAFIPNPSTLSSGITGSQYISTLNNNFNEITVPMLDFTALEKYNENPIISPNVFKINDTGEFVWQISMMGVNIANKIGDTYYCLASANNGASALYKYIVLYTSTDLINWTLYSTAPRLTAGLNDDHLLLGKAVIKIGNLWYYYYSAQNTSNEHNIFLATSPDFITWTKYSTDPIYNRSQDSGRNVYNPCIIKIGELYYLYYTSYAAYANCRISYATSSDGITWSYGGIALENVTGDWTSTFIDSYIIKNSSGYYEIVFAASAVTHPTQGIGYAISDDGIHWVKRLTKIFDVGSGEDFDAYQVGEPQILQKTDGSYYIYYLGVITNGTASNGLVLI